MREARVAQLTAALPDRRADVERLEAEREDLAAAATTTRDADAEASAAQERAEAERSARRSELLELEGNQGGAGARLGELEREAQATAIEASRRDEALAALARERELAMDGLPETTAEAPRDEIEALDDEALEQELRRVRRTLAQIGSVNPFAVEEHREVAARLDEMSGQDADLRGAIGSTEELIARLDGEIEEQFDAAFRAIGEKFDEFCRLLFAGGSASLQMADEADGDAAGGIEIVVRPPGKRLQRLAMLSGGERALTGVALLFAMLTVNPVPFCILDEVDAALDEANIGRFAAGPAQALRVDRLRRHHPQPSDDRGGRHDLRRDHDRCRRQPCPLPSPGRRAGRGRRVMFRRRRDEPEPSSRGRRSAAAASDGRAPAA